MKMYRAMGLNMYPHRVDSTRAWDKDSSPSPTEFATRAIQAKIQGIRNGPGRNGRAVAAPCSAAPTGPARNSAAASPWGTGRRHLLADGLTRRHYPALPG